MALGEQLDVLVPAVILAVIGLLCLLLRWVVGGAAPERRGRGGGEDNFGLLRVAALTDDRAGAEVVRALLARAGIRATVAAAIDGRVRVLVFARDLDRARRVVSGPAA